MADRPPDDLSGAQSRDLVRFHLTDMLALSPVECVHAVDVDVLQRLGICVLSAWDGQHIAGIGALRVLADGVGELKCMRVHPAYRSKGVGSTVLAALLAEARGKGLASVAIETGSGEAFAATIEFYKRNGFAECGPIGGYPDTPFNRFFALHL